VAINYSLSCLCNLAQVRTTLIIYLCFIVFQSLKNPINIFSKLSICFYYF
jgi:hypothetical protein